MGPRQGEDDGHPAHPAAGRRRRRPHARAHGRRASTARSRSSWSASRCSTTAARAASWTLVDGDRHAADATGAGVRPIRLQTDMALGIEGGRVRARHVLRAGRAGLLRAVVGRGPGRARRRRRGRRAPGRHHAVLARLAGRGRAAVDHPYRQAHRAVRAGDQGPHLHADRGDGRGAHHVAARDPGRRAQLGLPLHVDARLDLHPPGAALPQPRLGGRRVHAVRRRARARSTTAACRSCTGSTAGAT